MSKQDKVFTLKNFEEVVNFSSGFSLNNGLNSSLGVMDKATAPIGETPLIAYLQDEGYFYTDKGVLYKILGASYFPATNEIFSDAPNVCQFDYQGAKASLFGTDRKGVLITPTEIKVLPSGNYSVAENHFGALYLADGNIIRYSERYDQLNFFSSRFKGGELKIDITYGKIISLVSFNNYLYIFCEKAIARLEAYGDAETLKLTKVFEEINLVNRGSVVKCGGEIIFESGDKLFSITNTTLTEICKFLNGVKFEFGCQSSFYDNGKYFTKLDLANSAHNYILVYDTFEKFGYLLNVKKALPIGGLILSADKTHLGIITETDKIFSEPISYEITFKPLNFGSLNFKRITGVAIDGDFKEITAEIKGSYAVNSRLITNNFKTRFNILGEKFVVKITAAKKTKIDKITFIFQEEEN